MIHVVWNEAESEILWAEGRDDYRPYLFETLAHLGFTWTLWDTQSWSKERPQGVTILLSTENSTDWKGLLEEYCASGNALLGMGRVEGLESLLGVRATGSLPEGWISWEENCPVTDGLQSSFHCFDASLLEVSTTTDNVETWGEWTARNGSPRKNPAFVLRSWETGVAALFTFDMMKTLCLLQQGVPVVRDGPPAPDGTAAIDEGILKTDDGTVLDWVRDRNPLSEGAAPFYLHPIADEIRALLVKALALLHEKIGAMLMQTWFWPEGLSAIGHISHDTDGNKPELAERMLDRLAEANVHSSWCTIMPGYPAPIYDRIIAEGHEMAFHYNALGTEIPESSWSEKDFLFQLEMLREQVPGVPMVSSKNHYLRWEGGNEFYDWCERAEIRVEQSRGGTKQGNKGFLFGTCHPLRVIGTAREKNRIRDIISLPTLAWDPPMPARCTLDEAKALLRRCEDVYGVAHFLFHPGTIEQSADGLTAGEAMVSLCEYGREGEMDWWTSRQIDDWMRQRRDCQIETTPIRDGSIKVTITCVEEIKGLTFFLFQENSGVWVPTDDLLRSLLPLERFGRAGVEVILDVPAGKTTFEVRSSPL
jgi:hypothetical protein